MTTTVPVSPSTGIAGQTASIRIVSIDIFRGLTMAVMIFVNDLDSVRGLSKWTYHMAASVDAMTYVDMVFPAFLFIVGMALPLAIRQRLRRDASLPHLWMHIALRAAALIIIGLILANVGFCDRSRMHLSPWLWALLGLAGSILLWNVYTGVDPRLVRTLRLIGAALIVFDFAIFRRSVPGGEAWIKFTYPEILGLIGFTYFAVCLLYIPTRRSRVAPLVWLVLLIAYNSLCSAHWLQTGHIPIYVLPFGDGAMPTLVMAGVVMSQIFLDADRPTSPSRKMLLGLLMGVLSFAAGWLLMPLGISKIRATPTWALWSIAACALLFTLLYWLCDMKKHTRWAWLVRPAGSNTLLTYLLPDIYYFLVALTATGYLQQRWNAGWPGVIRALVFTIAILLLSHAVTRARLRMQL